LAGFLGPGAVILFSAGLGAGKTTLTKGIARGLGIRQTITSPTYTIISEYPGRPPLYHIDLYRIEDAEELENLDLRDILNGNGVSVVEWSERLPAFCADEAVRIAIRGEGESERVFDISIPGGEEGL
jgi:tRNA threonylcarbamoyladenosine biosynthesis protein TsaE